MGPEIAAMSVAACGIANKYGDDTRSPLNRDLAAFEARNAANRQIAAQNNALQNLGSGGWHPVNPVVDPKKSMSKRLVRVFLVDPNESVPLDVSMLYKSEEKLTDLTDQELFFEIPVQELLTKHNAARVTLLDKAGTKRSNKDVYLEPAKIRDLTMTVLVLETW